jgi:DNA-binding GntR family transcriptional regulator
MPEGFAVSERVNRWAQEHGYDRLGEHLQAFARKCAANGYAYADWDSAFMEAIREDWAKLRGRSPAGVAPPPEKTDADIDRTTAMLAEQAAHAAVAVKLDPAKRAEISAKMAAAREEAAAAAARTARAA